MQPLSESIFKQYDIRGIYPIDISEYTVKLIGYFLGVRIAKQKPSAKVCIGYDAREHSPQILSWLCCGLNDAQVQPYNMGLTATPVNYFSSFMGELSDTQINASIMITASHNPKEYNGFKITLGKRPFFGDAIQELKEDIKKAMSENRQIGSNDHCETIDINSLYIDFITSKFAHLKTLDKRILLDSGNGCAGFIIQEIFDRLGLKTTHLFQEPDGSFPNHHPDPSKKENLQDVYKHLEAHDIAFAYDGDGDRLAVLTNKHEIKGDYLAILFAKQMTNPTIIGEVKCSSVMYDEINKIGTAIMHKTGHSNIKEKLIETNADMAAEVSGHLFFNDEYFGYDDAIYSTFRVLELGTKIDIDDELIALPHLHSTDELQVSVSESHKFEIIENIIAFIKGNLDTIEPKITSIIEIDGLRCNFENGWALVRASNTTPCLVTRFEANKELLAKQYQTLINSLITKYNQ